jgi:hypothetical protein
VQLLNDQLQDLAGEIGQSLVFPRNESRRPPK